MRTILLTLAVSGALAGVASAQGFTLVGRISTDREAAQVQLVLEDSKTGKPSGARVEPNAKGEYSFSGLAARDFRLVAYIDGRKQDARKIEILCRPGATLIKDFHYGKSESTLMLTYPAEDPDTVDIAQMQGEFPRDVHQDYERAHRDYSGGNLRRALERLQALASRAPRYYKAHALMGLAYQDSGCYADAETEFAVASDVSPRTVHPLLNLASAQLRLSDIPGQRDESLARALSTLDRAAKVRPDSPLVYCLMGSAQMKQENLDDAEKSLLRALDIHGSLGIARLMLANVYGKKNYWTAAAEQLRTYLQENPLAGNRSLVKEMLAEAEKK
jgi:tetratricopeptide (TPR) repeat protein